jgi:hypothetical protein
VCTLTPKAELGATEHAAIRAAFARYAAFLQTDLVLEETASRCAAGTTLSRTRGRRGP